MASVIINDFEVVTELPTPPAEAPQPAPSTPPSLPGPTPEDIRHVVRTREQRMARLFAH